MKSNQSKYIEEVIKGFQQNSGRASVYCFPPISYAELVFNIINLFNAKSPGTKVFIVVDDFATRKAIMARLEKDTSTTYNVTVLSADYIKTTYKYDYKLIITVGLNDNLELISFLNKESKFMLSVITKNIMDSNYINAIRDILPNIEVTVSNASVRSDNIYSPVEEFHVGVDLSTDDRLLYDKYTEYISTSVSVFGDIHNIEKCKYGDPKLGISGADFRESIAKENGWNITLDTSVEWSRQIDDIYNPNVLYERANNFYNITKQRRDLVTDNTAKLEAIVNICLNNKDKKILIVSKRGEFASNITKYINDKTELKCLDYHDSIDNAILFDGYGEPVLIKSGKDKGQPKVVGAIKISSLNLSRFNDLSNKDMINCLSIKNSSNVKLETAIDLMIYTSAFVDGVIDFKTRFANVVFNAVPTIIHKVYCRGTIENKHLSNQKESPLITVISDTDNFIGYEENNFDIVL